MGLIFGGDCNIFPQIKKTRNIMLDRTVRLPFANDISKNYRIRSCSPDATCGNGIHHFHVEAVNAAGEVDYSTEINFQHGALNQPNACHNGLLSTILIQILITHLTSFQAGPYEDSYTSKAIEKLQEALLWLSYRSDEREARNVLGMHAK